MTGQYLISNTDLFLKSNNSKLLLKSFRITVVFWYHFWEHLKMKNDPLVLSCMLQASKLYIGTLSKRGFISLAESSPYNVYEQVTWYLVGTYSDSYTLFVCSCVSDLTMNGRCFLILLLMNCCLELVLHFRTIIITHYCGCNLKKYLR